MSCLDVGLGRCDRSVGARRSFAVPAPLSVVSLTAGPGKAPPSFSQRLIAFAFNSASVSGLAVLSFLFLLSARTILNLLLNLTLSTKAGWDQNLISMPNDIHSTIMRKFMVLQRRTHHAGRLPAGK
jgi:hypothetical protein